MSAAYDNNSAVVTSEGSIFPTDSKVSHKPSFARNRYSVVVEAPGFSHYKLKASYDPRSIFRMNILKGALANQFFRQVSQQLFMFGL